MEPILLFKYHVKFLPLTAATDFFLYLYNKTNSETIKRLIRVYELHELDIKRAIIIVACRYDASFERDELL